MDLRFLPVRFSSMRIPILIKMLIVLLPLALGPLIILGAMSIRRGTEAVGHVAEQNLQLVATSTAARLDQYFIQTQWLQGAIAKNQVVIKALSTPPAHRKALLQEVERWMKDLVATNAALALGYIADAKGVCIVSSSPDMVGRDYSKTREYMRRAIAGENFISDLAVGITTKEPGVFFSGPVRDRGGRLVGAIVLKLRGETLDRVNLEVGRQTTGGHVVLIDGNGIIISHPDPKRLYNSLATLSAEALVRIDPKLMYGVEHIENGRQDELAKELAAGKSQGYLTFKGDDLVPRVAGYARMTTRPWTVAVVQPRSQFDQPMTDLALAQKWWIAGMALLAALCAVWITWGLLRPVRALGAAAAKAGEGDWSARADVHSNDELGDLAKAFNEMMPALQERTRLASELRFAREIQMGMLPYHYGAMESAYGVELAAVLEPAREVGGDLYGVCAAADDRLVMFLGDVSGKGIPASMFMVRAVSLARLLAREIAEPERILARLNDELAVDNPSGMFVTFLCAVYESAGGRLSLANAGHCKPVLLRSGAPPGWAVPNLGTALGFEPGIVFERTELLLRPGDAIVFYTDGVTEAFNPREEWYGNDRLLAGAEDFTNCSAMDITAGIHRQVRAFADGAPQSDDIAILTMRCSTRSAQRGGSA